MLAKRIIPCLDVHNGRVVKGVNFVNLIDAGDPVEQAAVYDKEGADELVFLDIGASHEGRKTTLDMVKRVADTLFIPFCVGGGIRTIEDIRDTLLAGADKVSINSAAIRTPDLIDKAAWGYGSQCIVVAIDPKRIDGQWIVHINGGRVATEKTAVAWAKECESRGAGEILLTSMDRDGTKIGFDIPLTRAVADAIDIPVIASGGVGTLAHLADGVSEGHADAVLAASIFHYGEHTVGEAKAFMRARGIEVR